MFHSLGGTPGLASLSLGAHGEAAGRRGRRLFRAATRLLVATAIALSTHQSVFKVWNENFLWSAPSYFVGALAAAGVSIVISGTTNYWIALLAAPPLYLTYRSYKIYLGRIEDEQRHVQEVSDLHLATIEALALAIDAKDRTGKSHIRRVQVFAAGLARAIGMSENEIQGVKTAALLHDIGKLAVPEHILSKPGPLTQEEFQKIRIHPQVGAEIIAGVPFPYPVAPLILSHHERWDGKGYPAGMKGEEIPAGARILAVVDYFDALTSERPYHKAMSDEGAVGLLRQEAGKALDPKLVQMFVDNLDKLRAEAETTMPDSVRTLTLPTGTSREGTPRGRACCRSRRTRPCSTTSRSRIARSTRCTKSRRRWARASAWPTRWRSSRRSSATSCRSPAARCSCTTKRWKRCAAGSRPASTPR